MEKHTMTEQGKVEVIDVTRKVKAITEELCGHGSLAQFADRR